MESRVQSDKTVCYICGKPMTRSVVHHLFPGTANRQKADEDGMFVYVHATCHDYLHSHAMTNETFKCRGQMFWEELYGTREEFIKRYGISFIDKRENNERKKNAERRY